MNRDACTHNVLLTLLYVYSHFCADHSHAVVVGRTVKQDWGHVHVEGESWCLPSGLTVIALQSAGQTAFRKQHPNDCIDAMDAGRDYGLTHICIMIRLMHEPFQQAVSG